MVSHFLLHRAYLPVATRLGLYYTIVAVFVVSVAQLVERWIVAPVVEGSNPFTHPIFPPHIFIAARLINYLNPLIFQWR
jgi:hypothetical protein